MSNSGRLTAVDAYGWWWCQPKLDLRRKWSWSWNININISYRVHHIPESTQPAWVISHLLHHPQLMRLHHHQIHFLHQHPQVIVLCQEFRVRRQGQEERATPSSVDGCTGGFNCLQNWGLVERAVSIMDLQTLDVFGLERWFKVLERYKLVSVAVKLIVEYLKVSWYPKEISYVLLPKLVLSLGIGCGNNDMENTIASAVH